MVYFFLMDGKGRSLEELDTMYVLHVDPRTSAKWSAKDGKEGVSGVVAGNGGMVPQKAEVSASV